MKNFLKMSLVFLSMIMMIGLSSCSENYSNGERVGYVTQFSKTGVVFKTYEAHLNVTQTGMNTGSSFDFSVDRDNQDGKVLAALEEAAQKGQKVKITYHEVFGWNWWNNRGETDHFVTQVEILDSLGTIQAIR